MGLVERVKSRIRALMLAKGMTIYEFAKKTGISEACIKNWYNKRNYTPSLETIEKMCIALGISETDLLKREEQETCLLDEDEQRLIKYWEILDKDERDALFINIELYIRKK